MTDTTTAAEAVRVAVENEASREVIAQAEPDNPNPTTPEAAPHPDPLSASGERDTERAEAKPLERVTAADRSRADIAARFKEKRAAAGGQVEFHGDMRDPSQTYGPYAAGEAESGSPGTASPPTPIPSPQGGEEAQAVPPVAQPASEPAEPRLVKVKVHGREMFLPQDQVIAEAQKSLTAGNLLESAKEVLSWARNQMTDDGGRTTDDPSSVVSPLPSDRYIALAQTLQMESADAAGSRLKQAIESETAKARQEAAREAARHVRIETELAASQRALAAFEQAHPDLSADEFARDAVTTQVQREINADLAAAVSEGILKELPKSQDERNGLHTQLRAFGAPVRSIGDIFTAAGNKYATWRGGAPSAALRAAAGKPAAIPTPQSQPAAAAPRVELSPDRAQRRAAIPSQPTNGTAPPQRQPQPEQTTGQRRSAAIMAMRRARGQIVA
jgi:hypothetical protein